MFVQNYAPEIFAFFFGSSLMVEGNPQALSMLSLYFFIAIFSFSLFMGLNGSYAMYYSVYWCNLRVTTAAEKADKCTKKDYVPV